MVGLFPNAFEVVCELLRQSLQDLWCRIHPSPQLQEDDALIVSEYPPVTTQIVISSLFQVSSDSILIGMWF